MAQTQPWWKPVWSVPAALRAIRACVVVPALFALAYKVLADPQTALFATFGGFATLVVANFGGTRKDKLIAHAGLAVVGSLALIVGTLVSATTWLAALVTVPVAFAIFFAGVAGPNAVSGSTAAMFAYVLPVVSAGGAGTIPSRLEGWWLASVAGTAAVLLLSPPAQGDRLRAAAAELAGELASRVNAAADGQVTQPQMMRAAKEKLRAAFAAAPYRPTGLAAPAQALASLVQLLDWGGAQVGDAFDGHVAMTQTCAEDRDLLRAAAALFGDARALLSGGEADPDFARVEQARARSARHLRDLSGRDGEPDARMAAAHAVHSQAIAVIARGAAAEALVAARRADPQTIAAERRKWYGLDLAGPAAANGPAAAGAAQETPGTARTTVATPVPVSPNGQGRLPSLSSSPKAAGLAQAAFVVSRHATVRSVWFLNSLRGALALAAAVAVADLSTLQHGFWVVLGTLSVLRTNAASTGATAWRALAGTVVGFAVGAALLLAIGTAHTSLWVALPVAVAVAAYAPGTTPFLVGQAAFTVTIVVLFNLLAPVGWRVGLLRVEDVAIGCGVSLVVGVLFWPRGASSVVGDDLADAFRRGAEFLTQAVEWALSELMVPPTAAAAAVGAGIRLDDAVRGFLTEQGSKRVSKDDLWTLVNASTRLRLSAHALSLLRPEETAPGVPVGTACLPLAGSQEYAGAPACVTLRSAAAGLAGFYGQVADEVARPARAGRLGREERSGRPGRERGTGRAGEPPLISPPPVIGPAVPRQGGAAAAGGAAGAAGGAAADGAPGGAVADGRVVTDQLSHPHLLWVQEHLRHLSQSAQTVSEPARRMAEVRRRPWWR